MLRSVILVCARDDQLRSGGSDQLINHFVLHLLASSCKICASGLLLVLYPGVAATPMYVRTYTVSLRCPL
eukprot:scaffold181379_cov52-Prasinocladus_malaysianus.AAC.1